MRKVVALITSGRRRSIVQGDRYWSTRWSGQSMVCVQCLGGAFVAHLTLYRYNARAHHSTQLLCECVAAERGKWWKSEGVRCIGASRDG